MSTTVLVVEDDAEINELVGEYLSLENIKYVPAAAGQAGVHLARTQHPDALILDLMLPDITGFEVARTLTGARATYDIPIVVLSCMCQEADRQQAFSSGALLYVNKPFLPDDLLAALRKALNWRANLVTRGPAGSACFGADAIEAALGIRQMVADVFTQTQLEDRDVDGIREGMELLARWHGEWNKEHGTCSPLRVGYQIGSGNGAGVEWALTEDGAGMLAEVFFKGVNGTGSASGGWGLIGRGPAKGPQWSGPPERWNELLTRTGSGGFTRDAARRSVTFSRK